MKTNLQELRKAAGFTSAKAFAKHFGVNENTYTGYEQGKPMSLDQAWAFADEFDVTLDELAGRKRPKREYSNPLQAQLNEVFEYLDDANKGAAVGAVRGIAANQAEKKTGSNGLEASA